MDIFKMRLSVNPIKPASPASGLTPLTGSALFPAIGPVEIQ
ncbi:hypothetical protein [Aquamicrobium defluvii]|nr:hypothetical protein [Aquamicrobium defluvii]